VLPRVLRLPARPSPAAKCTALISCSTCGEGRCAVQCALCVNSLTRMIPGLGWGTESRMDDDEVKVCRYATRMSKLP
jgi:hypothetical protein